MSAPARFQNGEHVRRAVERAGIVALVLLSLRANPIQHRPIILNGVLGHVQIASSFHHLPSAKQVLRVSTLNEEISRGQVAPGAIRSNLDLLSEHFVCTRGISRKVQHHRVLVPVRSGLIRILFVKVTRDESRMEFFKETEGGADFTLMLTGEGLCHLYKFIWIDVTVVETFREFSLGFHPLQVRGDVRPHTRPTIHGARSLRKSRRALEIEHRIYYRFARWNIGEPNRPKSARRSTGEVLFARLELCNPSRP